MPRELARGKRCERQTGPLLTAPPPFLAQLLVSGLMDGSYQTRNLFLQLHRNCFRRREQPLLFYATPHLKLDSFRTYNVPVSSLATVPLHHRLQFFIYIVSERATYVDHVRGLESGSKVLCLLLCSVDEREEAKAAACASSALMTNWGINQSKEGEGLRGWGPIGERFLLFWRPSG